MKSVCVVCGADTPLPSDRCTNQCCISCHCRFCTDGGIDSPGHNLNLVQARQVIEAGR